MNLKKNIISLFDDRTAGSSSLLNKLNKIMREDMGRTEYLSLIIAEGRKRFIDFSIVLNYLDEIEATLGDKDALTRTIDFYDDYENKVNENIFANGNEYFLKSSKILTLSNSFTIVNFLTRLIKVNNKLEVIVTESRPRNEGRILTKNLIKHGIPVEFITDFSCASYLPLIDAVITGADKILSTGNIVNKTGSRNLAILCMYYNKPFYVITSNNKKSKDSEYIPEERNPEEVWRYRDNKLKVRNYYFEEIERGLITEVITD